MASAISSFVYAFSYLNGSKSSGRSPFGLLLCRLILLVCAPLTNALPFDRASISLLENVDITMKPEGPGLYAYLGTAVALVLLGGAFAGLTIALMGQDEIYLQVIATSGEGSERANAKKVLKLLKRGKHWVLVTLLLSNVITNETLPIVLDRSLGGGWPAVLSSTVLIVIFGEIVPQSICVRYGLPIGAWMSPLVLGLMWIMAPVAWPTAKLLDRLLGEDHGTTYKKAGLKTLVTLHKTLGTSPDDRLNQDEVTIITAVLDLKDKPVGSIMTPMKDVFTLSTDAVLDEKMMDSILSAGYSRIPIHTPDNKENFVGMLLVKMLITYDPEDALRVRDFSLATLPETRPDTSCLDIVNFFQEGKSHMVLVSDNPGESYGALGVVTLEDVIEELIGEEIIDESDVFVDVHKAIRRLAPAPRTRVPRGEIVADPRKPSDAKQDAEVPSGPPRRADSEPRTRSLTGSTNSPKLTTSFLVRRRSSGTGSMDRVQGPVTLRSNDPEFREHLKHLGPSNAANRPKQTRINTVKIKPGIPNTIPENRVPRAESIVSEPGVPQSGVGEGLLQNAGHQASDAVHALTTGYGTMANANGSWFSSPKNNVSKHEEEPTSPKSKAADSQSGSRRGSENHASIHRSHSASTLGSLHSVQSSPRPTATKRTTARSGSITENTIDVNGIKKIVLETTSSSDSDGHRVTISTESLKEETRNGDKPEADGVNEAERKKKNKQKKRGKRAGKKKQKASGGGSGSETTPLIGSEA